MRGFLLMEDRRLDLNNGGGGPVQAVGLYNPVTGPPRVPDVPNASIRFGDEARTICFSELPAEAASGL